MECDQARNAQANTAGLPCSSAPSASPANPALRLLAKYGNRLVSVRYRYDPANGKRYKTVELIVAEDDWLPPQPRQTAPEKRPEPPTTPIVPVRIHYSERDLQNKVKAIGGRWDASKKLWFAPEEFIKRIGLTKRIVR